MRRIGGCLLGAMLLVAAANGADAQMPALACHGTQRSGTVAELLFGRDIGGRASVSEAAFARFLAREITPRFPDGLTVVSASGQWRDPQSGTIVREPSEFLLIVLPGAADDQAHLDAVVAAYKRQFHQRSVVVVVQSACVSF